MNKNIDLQISIVVKTEKDLKILDEVLKKLDGNHIETKIAQSDGVEEVSTEIVSKPTKEEVEEEVKERTTAEIKQAIRAWIDEDKASNSKKLKSVLFSYGVAKIPELTDAQLRRVAAGLGI